jgi:hypothetical protein
MSGECANREERLVSLLYEDGDPAELAEIRAHLATCAACRDEFERLTATRGLLGAWSDVAHAPRVIYVNGPAGVGGHTRGGTGWGGFRPFMPSLAAAAAVVLLLAASASFLRLRVGPNGSLRLGFGASPASAAQPSALVTRGDLDQGLAQTASYLEATMRAARDQDRQAMLAVVDQTLRDQNTSLGRQMTSAIDSAFDEIDHRRRADLSVMLSSMNDLQVITSSELQRMNAMLASATPGPATQE